LESRVTPGTKYVGIWQSEENAERHFVRRLFEPYISQHILDGKHEVVLDNAILFDAWVYANDPDYYAAFRGKNAFLFHLSDEFYELGADRYVHFRGVFRSYWSSVFNPKHVMVLPLGISSVNTATSIIPASERRYAWSFVGDAAKSSRPELVRAMGPVEPHISYSNTPVRGIAFWNRNAAGIKRVQRSDFVKILQQSAFAPAPMGNANLESYRVYEALEAGAIPIVEKRLGLDYFHSLLGDHPLPTVRSWRQARKLVQRLLEDPQALDELQQKCFEWWKGHEAKVVEQIGLFLAERSAASEQVVPLRSALPSIPGWQYFELMRHQTLKGLGRRIFLQLSRLLSGGTWRRSHSKKHGMYTQ
jgi:hypothetical protein